MQQTNELLNDNKNIWQEIKKLRENQDSEKERIMFMIASLLSAGGENQNLLGNVFSIREKKNNEEIPTKEEFKDTD